MVGVRVDERGADRRGRGADPVQRAAHEVAVAGVVQDVDDVRRPRESEVDRAVAVEVAARDRSRPRNLADHLRRPKGAVSVADEG